MKRLIAILAISALAATMTACSDYERQLQYENRLRATRYTNMRTIDGDVLNSYFFLVCDESRDNVYLQFNGGHGGLSPYLDEDGNVVKCSDLRRDR